ncbi:lysylphosphatidylglycerol synthase transmembrane domain-containing protein [Neobacillus sp. DY30]|uniref:lysylphosphatidylglycerol synthase transmembrane domain-containing protein n=1 Tax=Neobacillus sp. DY30 TaxID=3047871 RepID=UPI0024BFD597|nr:lysylphosphatidylglycerol synthase transmembrane domain-containing protein [Neobacillus sp. DY30]WHY03412.1 lysylphosphatidylglycerol synthase transmembrane domain-containing protein [Neobacillus sp. DY30]
MRLSFKTIKFICSVIIIGVFFYLTVQYFNGEWIMEGIKAMIQSPFTLTAIFLIYFLSFCLKSIAWKVYLNGRPRFSTCLLGVIYSLFINHVLPVKAGDLVRMKVLSTRDNIGGEESAHSVIILRLLDIFCLIGLTMIGLFVLGVDFKIPTTLITIGFIIIGLFLVIVVRFFPAFFKRQVELLKKGLRGKNGMIILIAVSTSWVLEAAVLYGTVTIYHRDLSVLEAVFANSVTVSGQIFQITPGGIANYESFLVFALRLFGITIQEGYTIAIVTHAVKFFFSYVAGIMAIIIYPIPFNTMLSWIRVKGVRGR